MKKLQLLAARLLGIVQCDSCNRFFSVDFAQSVVGIYAVTTMGPGALKVTSDDFLDPK